MATATATPSRTVRFAKPSQYIDKSIPIHHCGMYDHLQASNLDAVAVKELAIEHAGKIVRAKLAGDRPPIHEAPGIQLLAVVLADSTLRAGAAKLAGDYGFNLDELEKHASSEHVSYC